MSLSDVCRIVRALEVVENYDRADTPFLELQRVEQQSQESWDYQSSEYLVEDADKKFWEQAFEKPQSLREQKFYFREIVLSEWVARVPGLFWFQGSEDFRRAGQQRSEFRSHKEQSIGHIRVIQHLAAKAFEQSRFETSNLNTYSPPGKSLLVMGGIGTFKFPPDEMGMRLVSLSSGCNASSGIPAMILPEVWEYHGLSEGSILEVSNVEWKPMAQSWAERFPSIRGIPRGYLLIKHPNQVDVKPIEAPTQFHPCTVMEYSSGDIKLYDFVYATADTRVSNYRSRLEDFFDTYKRRNERYGRYLLSADIADPLWDAEYQSPIELRRAEVSARAHLKLMESRVYESISTTRAENRTIQDILQILGRNYNQEGLKRLSIYVGISPALWYSGGSIADLAAEFLDQCLYQEKVVQLIDRIVTDYPDVLDETA